MSDNPHRNLIVVDKRTVGIALAVCIIVLHLLNIPAVWFRAIEDPSSLQNLYATFFSVGAEGKVPTWYSACTIFACSGLLSLIAFDKRQRKGGYFFHWIGLALIFAFMSLDESMQVHEMANRQMSKIMEFSGPLAFSWVIPAFVFLLVFFAVYVRFLFHLPRRTLWLFVASGTIYLGGVLGLEMVSADHFSDSGRDLTYLIIATFEEVLEMSGIALFVYSLLDHISREARLAIHL